MLGVDGEQQKTRVSELNGFASFGDAKRPAQYKAR